MSEELSTRSYEEIPNSDEETVPSKLHCRVPNGSLTDNCAQMEKIPPDDPTECIESLIEKVAAVLLKHE